MMGRRTVPIAAVSVAAMLAAGCSTAADGTSPAAAAPAAVTTTRIVAPTTTTTTVTTTTSPPPATTGTTTTTPSPFARPDWLGTRPLPLRADEHGEVQPTPPELVDRRLETPDVLPPPRDAEFAFTVGPIPPDVLARSSWTEECPVTVDELAYLTVSHYGFDGEFHTGEIIINAAVAEDVVEVFRRLHEARFPIEQMRVITKEEIDAPPTGDWNDTTSFVCRPAVGSGNWSWHAYGLAIDINPFHNPYEKGDLVLPELASAYVDRSDLRDGMIEPGDVVTEAFAAIGWQWGGNWRTLKDWMHFSRNGG
jgi:hypothetical protein